MEYLPLNIELAGVPCLLVGGGVVAQRKASLLLRAGALLTVVATEISPHLRQQVESSGGRVHKREFVPEDLDKQQLVVVATNNQKLNSLVSAIARQQAVWVNVVDSSAESSVIFPSIVDRSPLLVSVSTAGRAPVLARSIRSAIESLLPDSTGKLAVVIGAFRDKVRKRLTTDSKVRLFWEQLIASDIASGKLLQGGAESSIQNMLDQFESEDHSVGEVYLVGAGPGDPDLLTFKALRLLQKADIVLYDRLVSDPVLDMARRDAERVYVGKRNRHHSVAQPDLNELLVHHAKLGKRVVRLKGGDPFVFGRGGEEIEKLAEQGIPFQVVPGVTAANACACYAGIPLTHRDYAQSVRFIAGHRKQGGEEPPWQELVSSNETLVVYMGLLGIGRISQKLIEHGRGGDTPVALIEKGTTPEQQVHVATLASIERYLEGRKVQAPTLLIIGEVVALREMLGWSTAPAE